MCKLVKSWQRSVTFRREEERRSVGVGISAGYGCERSAVRDDEGADFCVGGYLKCLSLPSFQSVFGGVYGENFTSIVQVYESSECAQYDANHCQKISLIFFGLSKMLFRQAV